MIKQSDLVPGALLVHPSIKWRLPGTVISVTRREGDDTAWTLFVLPLANRPLTEVAISVEDLDVMTRLA